MTRQEIKNRLHALHDGRSDRSQITDAEWCEIDQLENDLAALNHAPLTGFYPRCLAAANPNEI